MGEDFKDGFVTYTVTRELPSDFSFSGWDDGYVAFSKGEKPLKDILANIDIKDKSFVDVINNKIDGIYGVEGFLMELDLWRNNNDGAYEEISIERNDSGFLVQEWKLETKSEKDRNCYWRMVDTSPRDNSIFKDLELKSIEVVYPENRLHFFLTVGGDKNANW